VKATGVKDLRRRGSRIAPPRRSAYARDRHVLASGLLASRQISSSWNRFVTPGEIMSNATRPTYHADRYGRMACRPSGRITNTAPRADCVKPCCLHQNCGHTRHRNRPGWKRPGPSVRSRCYAGSTYPGEAAGHRRRRPRHAGTIGTGGETSGQEARSIVACEHLERPPRGRRKPYGKRRPACAGGS